MILCMYAIEGTNEFMERQFVSDSDLFDVSNYYFLFYHIEVFSVVCFFKIKSDLINEMKRFVLKCTMFGNIV